MKENMPVTNNEVFMTEGKPIISKANLKEPITAIPLAATNLSISRIK